jgi:density-regulated protein DRP1
VGGAKKGPEPEVFIELNQRNKRKFTTIIYGLDTFDVKLKDASKKLGKKFAASCSIVKDATGAETLVIQG